MHWDVTNGYPGMDPSPGANQRDILYLSTHGWPNQLRFYNPRWVGSNPDNADWTQQFDQNGEKDNIGPSAGGSWGSSTYGYQPNRWEIGAAYKPGSLTRTTSRWNDDIEWVVLAACDQLSATSDSRTRYARTLLGDPQRAHSIMGYKASGPGDANDVSIVNSFFDLMQYQNKNIRFAWLTANSYYSGSAQNAAMLLHTRHINEGLPPIAPRQTDSPAGGTVALEFWHLVLLNPAGYPEPLSQRTESPMIRVAEWLRDVLGDERAFAAEAPALLKGRSATLKLAAELPESPGLVEVPAVVRDARGPEDVARQALGRRPQAAPVRVREGVTLLEADGRSALVYVDGNFVLQEDTDFGADKVDFGADAAVVAAAAYATERTGLPEDAELAGVTEVRAGAFDPLTGDVTNESTRAYVVEYRHSFSGIPIAGVEGDIISVVVGPGQDVINMRRTWRKVAASGKTVRVMDAAEALNGLAMGGERAAALSSTMNVTNVRLVYYAKKSSVSQSAMQPAWEFTLMGEETDEPVSPCLIYVDASTGKVLMD